MWGLFKKRKSSPGNGLATPSPPNNQEIRTSGWQVQNGDLVQQYGFFGGANHGMWWQLRCIMDRDDFAFIHVIASIQLVKGETWLVGSLRDEAALMNSPFSSVQTTDVQGGGTLMNFTDRAAVELYLSVLKTARFLDLLLLDKQSEVVRIYLPNDPYEFQASFARYRAGGSR